MAIVLYHFLFDVTILFCKENINNTIVLHKLDIRTEYHIITNPFLCAQMQSGEVFLSCLGICHTKSDQSGNVRESTPNWCILSGHTLLERGTQNKVLS